MITGIFGLPGSGKTCFLTYLAFKALSGKEPCIGMFSWRVPVGDAAPYKRVFTNFPVPGCIQLDFDALGMYDFSDSLILNNDNAYGEQGSYGAEPESFSSLDCHKEA